MTKNPSRGAILIFVLIASAVVMITTTAFFNYFASAIKAERFSFAGAQAQSLAEAGVDKAVYELNQSSGYSGETNTALGNGSFTVSVSSIDSITKRITVTASVPNSSHPTATKVVKVNVGINSSIVSFRYGVQIGEGGVTMSNGSKIIGNLFANGDVSGSGSITGDATVAMGVSLTADQQSTAQNSDYKIGDVSGHVNVAQSFKPSETATLAGISLKLKKTGNPSDLVIKIVTDNSGKPSKTVLASGLISTSLVTGSYSFAQVTLDSTPSFTANQAYWIIAIAPVSATNYFTWGLDTNSGYSRGAAKYSSNWNVSNPTWSSITGDLSFMMYLSIPTTLSGVSVGGNVWAQSLSSCTVTGNASYQTTSTCSVKGTKTSGVIPATPVPFPISDAQIADWEATAVAGGTLQGPYSYSGTQTLGPKKINGNLTVSNGATLKLSGPLWVNGNVEFSNNAFLLVDAGTGTSGAVIIADATGNTATAGKVLLSNNVTISGNGSPNSFPMIISTNTGSDAINMANNASSIILYAPYGTIEISNGALANQITAKRLDLDNNTTISYVNGLQSTSFSNGPGGSWGVVPGTYTIVQ